MRERRRKEGRQGKVLGGREGRKGGRREGISERERCENTRMGALKRGRLGAEAVESWRRGLEWSAARVSGYSLRLAGCTRLHDSEGKY